MLTKPSRSLRDLVPNTFPLSRLEEEAQDGGYHPGAPEPELAGEASPQPIGLPGLRKGVLTPGRGGAWSGLMNTTMQVRPPWAPWVPVLDILPQGGLEEEAQDRGLHPNLWPRGRARMGPVSMTWLRKPPQVSPAIWAHHSRCPGVSEDSHLVALCLSIRRLHSPLQGTLQPGFSKLQLHLEHGAAREPQLITDPGP
ncbi:hypothetical protein NDU88_003797 [Pleurodeles waltl]|uniref:Uncharacterized protein n=1 Tax=Pleurodeles waltl TaxID=8319 RepID=A0AAV7UZH0_PLEWA|nr:hypothetical protein NDU88_003797 [Pleurodeles waltl]